MKELKKIKTDVLICGGGCAGIAAAIAASRNNARTLLVERAPFSGGIITTVGLPFFDGIADKKTGRVVVRGIPFEMLMKMGRVKPGATVIKPHNPTLRSTEEFKVLADRMLTAHGESIRVLYNSSACDVRREGDRISAVMVANKDGLVEINASQVIDCTGDGDIAHWAEVPVEKTMPLMPMTLHFRVGNVKPNPELRAQARESLKRASEAGKLPMFYGPGLMYAFAKDEIYVHAVRVPGDASDAEDLSRAEIQGRSDAWTMFEAWKKEVPGFEDSYFVSSGPYIGIRETRRLVGQHVLSAKDIKLGRRFDDAVATGCWYMDRHPNHTTIGSANDGGGGYQPDPYDIPYRALVAKKVDNLLVAGRCHSASAEAASSTRVTVTAMAMGQAAGTAAAMAVKEKKGVAMLDGVKVREELTRQGAGPLTDE
ncbi:MAG: FAD-dependent oxidoreductase [Verrucomicrobiota bacterium]